MNKNALTVGAEYALWTGSGSYDTARHRGGWGRYRYLGDVQRIKGVSLDKIDVPAGPHTKVTIKVPGITVQRLTADGTKDGKPTTLRNGRDILAPYAEWLRATELDRRAAAREKAEREAKDAERQAVLDDVAQKLGLTKAQRESAHVRSYRDDKGYTVTISGIRPPAKRRRKAAA